MLQIDAIFSDYDGTLSPFAVNRDNALVPRPLYKTLSIVSKKIPFCIITTKTVNYIQDKIEFCKGVAGIGGLEISIGAKMIYPSVSSHTRKSILTVFDFARSVMHDMKDVLLEEKKTAGGELLGFTVDWRLSKNWDSYKEVVRPLIQKSKRDGLFVLTYRDHPFFDVYVKKPDKGKALIKLKKELRINGNILYLGDSENDSTAFEKSGVSIGITREEVKPLLNCEYLLPYDNLNAALRTLVKNNMIFDPVLLNLKRNSTYDYTSDKQ